MKPASWIHVALGGWLIAAPFVLRYTNPNAKANDLILGLAVFGVALWEGRSFAVPSGALVMQLILASWIFLAPFALRYVGMFQGLTSDIVVAALLIITSVAMITAPEIPGGPPTQPV